MTPIVHTADIPAGFFPDVVAMAERQNLSAEGLVRVWFNESGLYNWAVGKNPDGSPAAYGLNQILGSILRSWGIDPDAFIQIDVQRQLPTVERYYAPHASQRLDTVARLYQANFLPATLGWGSDPDLVLLYADPSQRTEHVGWIPASTEAFYYRANKSFDREGKQYITVGDLDRAARSHDANPRLAEALGRLADAGGIAPPSSMVPPWIGPIAGLVIGVGIAAWVVWRV